VTDLSVIAKFALIAADQLKLLSLLGLENGLDQQKIYILAWTTTPWTLPGNIALAMGEKIEYVLVRKIVAGSVDPKDSAIDLNYYLVASALADKIFGVGGYEVIARKIDPKKLEGMTYVPLFDFYKEFTTENSYKIILDDYVTTEDGTGVVHIAPMFGEDDYRVASKYHMDLIQHVNMNGKFKEEVTLWAGKSVVDLNTNREVAEYLAAPDQNNLFKEEKIRHSYPHCWRCDTPLLNYMTDSWFIKVADLKPRLLKNNKKIHWQPEHIQQGRFGKWLEGARDWAISRNRFWGCPMPIWQCEDRAQHKPGHDHHLICVGSIEELKKLANGKLPLRNGELDLHKPYIDEISFSAEAAGVDCEKLMYRIPEVLDCWFESGSMPYAQLHYPFENKQEFEDNFPANFIAEGVDQTRGWFYTLHVLASILFDKPAFQNVIVNGILLAADGEKLSKRKKNYPDPNLLFDTKGVDSTRMFLYTSTAPLAEDVRFSEKHVEEMVKKFTLPLWNSYSFFVTYSNIDGWNVEQAKEDFQPSHKLDQWILSELHQLIEIVTGHMNDYNLTKATRPMLDFIDNLSNWYIRRSRRRFWKSENDSDKFEAYQTLHTVLVEFSKLLAPFMPYLADEIYKNLTGAASVHLADWPKVQAEYILPSLNQEMAVVRKIVALGHAVRDKANAKVRQPLSLVQVGLPGNIDQQIVLAQKPVICEELNVKDLQMISDFTDLVERYAIPNAKVLGPKYGKVVQAIIQKAKAGEFELLADGKVNIEVEGTVYVLDSNCENPAENEIEIGFKGKPGHDVVSNNGITVILNTEITQELKQEGYAREIVRTIQDLRKEAAYNVDDRIYVLVVTEGEISIAVTKFADYISRETLAIELQQKGDLEWDKENLIEIEGVQVKVAVRRS